MRLPEIVRQPAGAAEQQVEIVDHLVVGVILGSNTEYRRLDAQVDILGNQHDFVVRNFLLEGHDRAQDRVVVLVAGQGFRQLVVVGLGLEEQPAAAFEGLVVGIEAVQPQAFVDHRVRLRGQQPIDEAVGLANVARNLGDADLCIVEFLEHLHGQEHMVLLEFEQGRGVVHQDVGIEHENSGIGTGFCKYYG